MPHMLGQPVLVDEILKVEQGVKAAIFGTVYKDMKLKPSILDEHHAREVHDPAEISVVSLD